MKMKLKPKLILTNTLMAGKTEQEMEQSNNALFINDLLLC